MSGVGAVFRVAVADTPPELAAVEEANVTSMVPFVWLDV